MINRKIVTSEDGSRTLKLDDFDESFHSLFGAFTESRHIYTGCGLEYIIQKSTGQKRIINILEVGLGTGLNCLLTAMTAKNNPDIFINYTAVEKYPVTIAEAKELDHPSLFEDERDTAKKISVKIHNSPWGEDVKLLPNFTLKKVEMDFLCFINKKSFTTMSGSPFDLIYFDAFAPDIQPELWSEDLFIKVFEITKQGGVLVTYSSKGIVKRALRGAGFTVTRLKGPKGKRHILRAEKLSL